jgi:hypothetical protein
MADVVDRANDLVEMTLENCIKKVTAKASIPKGIGICIECGEPVEGERRWCDVDCRDDWQRQNPGK